MAGFGGGSGTGESRFVGVRSPARRWHCDTRKPVPDENFISDDTKWWQMPWFVLYPGQKSARFFPRTARCKSRDYATALYEAFAHKASRAVGSSSEGRFA